MKLGDKTTCNMTTIITQKVNSIHVFYLGTGDI